MRGRTVLSLVGLMGAVGCTQSVTAPPVQQCGATIITIAQAGDTATTGYRPRLPGTLTTQQPTQLDVCNSPTTNSPAQNPTSQTTGTDSPRRP